MQAILTLEKLGFTFSLEGDGLKYELSGLPPSDVQKVESLLEELRLNKAYALSFLRERAFERVRLRLEYNKHLEREKKAEAWMDNPQRTDEELTKWMPLFNEILAGMNKIINEIGLGNCTEIERMNGFHILSHELEGDDSK